MLRQMAQAAVQPALSQAALVAESANCDNERTIRRRRYTCFSAGLLATDSEQTFNR